MASIEQEISKREAELEKVRKLLADDDSALKNRASRRRKSRN